MILKDKYNRIHNYLRISLSDKCNLNCIYCNPGIKESLNGKKQDVLTFEEISRLVRIFVAQFGFNKIRLTGGEPFVTKNIECLLGELNGIKSQYPFELSATSNGTLLNGKLKRIKSIGLDRLNISLDSLKSVKYYEITGRNEFENVLQTILEAKEAGFKNIKINTVVIREINDDEIIDFVDFIADTDINIRFIEYMPFSDNDFDSKKLINTDEIHSIISSKYILIKDNNKGGIAKDYLIEGHTGKVSFISPISDHFCDFCNRLRLSSYGDLKLCLFSDDKSKLSLRDLLRNGNSDEEIAEYISLYVAEKKMKHPELEELIVLKNNQMISIGG